MVMKRVLLLSVRGFHRKKNSIQKNSTAHTGVALWHCEVQRNAKDSHYSALVKMQCAVPHLHFNSPTRLPAFRLNRPERIPVECTDEENIHIMPHLRFNHSVRSKSTNGSTMCSDI